MVHTLIPMSVNIKIHTFENPARLVNAMELTCAMAMAYQKAGLPMPQAEAGMALRDFWDETVPAIRDNEKVSESLRKVIVNYIFKKGEIVDEDAIVTLKLGYENR